MDDETTTITTSRPAFTKALKRMLVPASATLLHPRTGEVISIRLGFRRMTDGELQRVRSAEVDREALGRPVNDDDILDVLAPVFGARDGTVEVEGLGDFPGPDHGSPEARFRRYFGGDGEETAEDLETEHLILRVLYAAYLQVFFRFTPLELVNMASEISLRGGVAPSVPETSSD